MQPTSVSLRRPARALALADSARIARRWPKRLRGAGMQTLIFAGLIKAGLVAGGALAAGVVAFVS